MSHRFIAAVASVAAMIVGGVAASPAAAANTLGPPPWTGAVCPAVGLDTGCQYGVDVTAVDGSGVATAQTIAEDGDQGAYDGDEDAMVVIKNDAAAPLTGIQMGIAGSGQQLFNFDSDGVCSGVGPSVTWTPPAGCPFGTTGYEGPGTSFTNIDPSTDSGTVAFSPALAPGATTYFSLETFPGIVPTAGNANNWPTSVITPPSGSQNAYVAVPVGTNVTDQATINGSHGAVNGAVLGDGTASGTVIYTLYANDRSCSSTPVYTSAAEPVTQGIAAASDAVGASLPAGRYYWMETYSGDGGKPNHNTASQSICGQEVLAIGTTAISTKFSPAGTVAPNTPVTDTAHIAAVVPKDLVNGTVTFSIFTDSACKVPYSGTPSSFSGITPTSADVSSGPVSLPSGIYYFVASYSGDDHNSAGASNCGSEVLHVANNASTIIKKPKVGNGYKLSFTIAVTDPGTFSWAFTASNKKGLFKSVDIAVIASGKKCGKGKIKVHGHCVPATITFGKGSKSIPPGLFTVTIKPKGKVKNVLNAGHKLKLTGLLSFHSLFGGTPTHQTVHVTVHGHKPKHKHKHK